MSRARGTSQGAAYPHPGEQAGAQPCQNGQTEAPKGEEMRIMLPRYAARNPDAVHSRTGAGRAASSWAGVGAAWRATMKGENPDVGRRQL